MRRVSLAVSLALAVAVTAAASTPAAPGVASLAPFTGLGTWVSIYDSRAWTAPEDTVATLAAHGVHTLYLETANYRQAVDVVRPAIVERFLVAAHAAGISVVGWYLPSLANPARDLRRALAGARVTAADGEVFDGYALDVEATVVHSIRLRNARAAALLRSFRRALGPAFPTGAITIAPVGASPSYWPGYPFAALARTVDVVLPMEYFTSRVRGAARVGSYTAANIRVIRGRIGDPTFPVHAIGGSAPRATRAEVTAFAEAASGCGTLGASLWELGATTASEWSALELLPRSADATTC